MRYGTSLCIVTELALEEGLRRVVEAGFSEVELCCHDTPVGRWWQDPAGTRELLERFGLRARAAHSPGAGWDNDAPDELVRRRSVDAASSIFAPARRLGVEVVIVHPNTTSHPYTPEDYEASKARSMGSLKVLAERAEDAGLRLAVENLPLRHTPRPAGNVAELLEMIDGLGPHVGLCLDAGHANANGRSPADEARIAEKRVFCVHIQDSDGKGEDQHLIPGEGTVDWDAFFAALDRFAPDALRNFEVPMKGADWQTPLAAVAALASRWEARHGRPSGGVGPATT